MDTYFFVVVVGGGQRLQLGPYLNYVEATLIATDHIDRFLKGWDQPTYSVMVQEFLSTHAGLEMISTRLTEERTR